MFHNLVLIFGAFETKRDSKILHVFKAELDWTCSMHNGRKTWLQIFTWHALWKRTFEIPNYAFLEIKLMYCGLKQTNETVQRSVLNVQTTSASDEWDTFWQNCFVPEPFHIRQAPLLFDLMFSSERKLSGCTWQSHQYTVICISHATSRCN